MLTYSPQAAFFLALFQLVPSALALTALAALRVWESTRPRAESLLIGGFSLLTTGLALQAAYCRFAVAPGGQVDLSMGWLLQVADATRAAASVVLGAAFLQRSGRGRRLTIFLWTSLVLFVLALGRLPSDQVAGAASIDPLTAARGAEVVILGLAVTLLGRAAPLPSAALLLLTLGRAATLAGAARPAVTELAWGAGALLVLAGLLLLPVTLEPLSKRRLLHYVLRFNLTFLALAASLVVVLSEISRRQFVEFSAEQVQDVVELLRGQLITGLGRGDAPDALLARPALTSDIIREFGRYSNLRRVTLELGGQSMGLAINGVGEIEQQYWSGARPALPPVAPSDFTEATLVERPIVADGEDVGRIELRQGVVSLNARIGEQMRVAFGVFTMFVVVGSLLTGILVLVADQTIRRQDHDLAEAQRRLLSSERLASVGAVADAVAHEVNNPAGVLIARSDYLLSVIRGQPWAAEIKDDLDTIRRQAQRIAKTVQDLLSSTRRARHAREPVDVGAVVQSAITLVRPLARSREITFDNGVSPGALQVWGDYGRIEQVFVNLLSNASQAILERGTVGVTASERPGGAWIDVEVADTGAGIHPEHMSRIFERFFTTKEPGMGSGLGLSIVAGIVREHGGHIDVESKVGHGTRFRVTLRACRVGAGAPDEQEDGAVVMTAPERRGR
jgi:signal transduction histidine kinase